jgi:hypothetical protein
VTKLLKNIVTLPNAAPVVIPRKLQSTLRWRKIIARKHMIMPSKLSQLSYESAG